MINLQEINDRINSDEALRERFITDPAKVLEEEGLIISPPMLAALKRLIESQLKDEPEVKGSSVSNPPGGRRPRAFGQL